MSLHAEAGTDSGAWTETGRIETGDETGGLWLHEPGEGAARDLRRADTVFPFTPDTFLDELVSLSAASDSGAPLTAEQFRALPAPVRNTIVAALLRRHAGTEAPPRAPGESDAAFLLRAWRQDHAEITPAPPAKPLAFAARGKARADSPANDAQAGDDAVPALMPETGLPETGLPETARGGAVLPEASPRDGGADDKPAIDTPFVVMRPSRRSGTRAALMLATMACLLALATLGVSMAMLLRQDGVDQAMMRSVRQEQDQMMAATKADQAAIAALTAEIRALHPTPAAASTQDTPQLRPQVRTASLHAKSRARGLPPIWPDRPRERDAGDFP